MLGRRRNPIGFAALGAVCMAPVCVAPVYAAPVWGAAGPLFGPPPGAPAVSAAVEIDPLDRTPLAVSAPNNDGVPRVAYAGVGSGFQRELGRHGLIPPPVSCPRPCPANEQAGSPAEAGAAPTRLPAPCGPERSPACPGDFSPDPCYDHVPHLPEVDQDTYGGKYLGPTQRPLVELGLPFYGNGPIPESQTWLGPTNLVQQKFYVYGDYRAAFAQNDLAVGEDTVLAHRANLDIDYWITSTERLHAFVGPFQEQNRFMRIEDGDFQNELDFWNPDTDALFFEGDLGQMFGGWAGQYAPIDLPITAGLVPLLFQNGIWMQDAMTGVAATLPARNSPGLDWSNYDVTFFAAFDQVTSAAFDFDQSAAHLYGATTFIEARGGYFELGYAYADSQVQADDSYHNIGLSYTRRYLNVVSNSVRVIVNAGQQGPVAERDAEGVLLLMENSLLTKNHYNVIPYVNFFAGFHNPQPASRGLAFGGVLFNTGILFQSDLLTSYPTLDATGHNTFGAAAGLDLLSPTFSQQVIVEVAAQKALDTDQPSGVPGDQLGLGARWQKPISRAALIRADAMVGWLGNSGDIAGARVEYRWKF